MICNLVFAIAKDMYFSYICHKINNYICMTTTIIILLSSAVVLLVLLIAVLVWRNIRQSDELRQKNDVIVREVRRNQALIHHRPQQYQVS